MRLRRSSLGSSRRNGNGSRKRWSRCRRRPLAHRSIAHGLGPRSPRCVVSMTQTARWLAVTARVLAVIYFLQAILSLVFVSAVPGPFSNAGSLGQVSKYPPFIGGLLVTGLLAFAAVAFWRRRGSAVL